MRWTWALAIAGALVGAVTTAARAQPATTLAHGPDAGEPGPSPAELGFRAATRLSAEGQPAAAARAIEALLASLPPDDPVADDALFELARLREEELGDLAGARVAYARLIAEHPGARLARRAEARAEALAHALGPDERHAATAAAG